MSFRNGLILLFTLLAGMNLPAQNPCIRHYTTADGLPSNTVYYIMQDSRHFIWFATDAGVARYDGSHFDYFTKKDGLSSNEVVRIQEDSYGRIWFFNLNGTINFFTHNTIFNERNAPYLDSLRSKEFFRKFFQDEDQTIYFYYNHHRDIVALDTQNNITRFRMPSRMVLDPLPGDSVDWMVIRCISKSETGEFILWTQAGMFSLKTLSDSLILISQKFAIKEVFPSHNHISYMFCSERYDGPRIILKCFNEQIVDTIPSPLPRGSTDMLVTSILNDGQEFLWVSTFSDGVFCLKDGRIYRHFDIKEGQSMIQDNEDNIWITSMKEGVYRVSNLINHNLQVEQPFCDPQSVTALTDHPGGGIWLTNGYRIGLLRRGVFYPLEFVNSGGPFNRIRYLKNNTLLVWQKSTPCYIFKDVRINTFTGKIHYHDRSCSDDEKGIKEIANNRAGEELATYAYNALLIFSPNQGIGKLGWDYYYERIYNVFYNRYDELIVNATKNYIHGKGMPRVSEELVFLNNRSITDHLIVNDSAELINVEGDSLYIYTSNRMYNLTAAFVYSQDGNIKHMVYEWPTLYLATANNIYVCEDPATVFLGKRLRLFPIEISFRNIQDLLVQNGMLYIASDDGLMVLPDSLFHERYTHMPIPYIHSVLVNDRHIDPEQDQLTLKGRNRISITFGSKSYSSSPVTYEYMLKGLDSYWIAGGDPQIVYQNLSPGKYTFKVRVRKSASPWSEPVEYPILIRTTLWQHPLFFTGISMLVVLLIALAIVWRKNLQMKRREIDHQLITLEQKALQSMMNPHFIFNALSSIQSYLLMNRSREAGLYLSQFARLIRQNLSAINSPMISLDEEIDRLKNYLDLEQMRMTDGFDYIIEMDDSIEEEEVKIPSMIIQPFAENAIHHGISPIDRKGMIRILLSMHSQKSLLISIEDNGAGIHHSGTASERSEKHLHMGIKMTRKRLEILGKKMNVKTSIEFSEAFPGSPYPGTRVVIVVPAGE